jgi:hypothetical protein
MLATLLAGVVLAAKRVEGGGIADAVAKKLKETIAGVHSGG